MSLNHLTELLKKNEANSIFSYETIWKDPKPLNDKYKTYLSPDSGIYHSVINPIFSFELEENNFQNFRIFSMLSLRDGIYPLMRFFTMNPHPHEVDPYLIIDERLSSVVPLAWRGRVFLRELFVKPKMISMERDEVLLLVSPDKDALPLEALKKELETIKEELKSFKKVSIYLSSCNSFGEEEAEYDSAWGYKALKVIFEAIPGKEIAIIDYSEYMRKNVSNIGFHFLNPYAFYFSDSYLLHDLLQRGAVPVKEVESEGFRVNISMNHGFVLHDRFSKKEYVADKFLLERVFKNSIYKAPLDEDFTNLKLSTPDFKDWVTSVAQKIYFDL